jgi:hypothetical protein
MTEGLCENWRIKTQITTARIVSSTYKPLHVTEPKESILASFTEPHIPKTNFD